MQGKLNSTQINNILSSRLVGRIACTDGKHPYIVPVTFTYDGVYLYGQTNNGRKLDILRKNPHVCFETDMITGLTNWQSVVIYGRFEELSYEEGEKARKVLCEHVYPLTTGSAVHPFGHEIMAKTDEGSRFKSIMYRIKILKTTGRFEDLTYPLL